MITALDQTQICILGAYYYTNDFWSHYMKIGRWIIWIILFIAVLVLVINNKQTVQFNFYGIYTWDVALIVLCFVFLLLGFVIGIIYSLMRSFELKTQIKLLRKDLDNARKNNPAIE